MNELLSTIADDRFVLWAINILIHTTLISIIVLAVAALLRRQAAMRYWLLCLGLLLVLISPAISAMVQSSGRGWLSLSVTASDVPGEREYAKPLSLPQTVHAEMQAIAAVNNLSIEREPTGPNGPVRQQLTPSDLLTRQPGSERVEDSAVARQVGSKTDWAASTLRGSVLTVAMVWAAVAVVLLTRVAVSWVRMSRILQSAEPIVSESFTRVLDNACRTVSWDRTHRPRPQLVVSSEVTGPIAAGIIQGKVVLPLSLVRQVATDDLSDVIVHEVAHIYRRDQIVVLFQNLAAALFWPHPLVRRLNCELAKAREEVCDNFVMAATDAPRYSRTLLTLAELIRRPTAMPGSVGFFASKWKLEQRIAGLLDAGRDRSTLLSRNGWILVAMTAIFIAAMICIGTITVSTAADDTVSDGKSEVAADHREMLAISGTVLEPDGAPAADAGVIVLRAFRANVSWQSTYEELGATTTDKDGKFEISVAAESDRFSNGKYLEIQEIVVLAHKTGHGPDQSIVSRTSGPQTLYLTSASHPIRGRVLDLEGKPIEGVRVRLQRIDKPGASVDQWLKSAKENPKTLSRDLRMSAFGGGASSPPVAHYPEKIRMDSISVLNIAAVTDQDGRFSISGIGDDQRAMLRIDGPTISSTLLSVVARDIEPVDTPIMDPRQRTGKTFGNDFVVTVEPSQIIRGQVRDKETGKPLPGVLIDLNNYPGDTMALDEFVTTRTDSDGRYTLHGVPKQASDSGRRMELFVEPTKEQPYFRSSHRVPLHSGLEPIDFDIELTPAIWAEGKVTDASSGDPVASLVAYHPYLNNPHADNHESFDRGMHSMGYDEMFATDADGKFRIPALPGRGVLRVVAGNDFQYELQPVPGINLSKQPGRGERRYELYHVMMPGNAIAEIDVDDNETIVRVDPQLQPLKKLRARVTAPDGSEATDFYVAGQTPTNRPTTTGRGMRYWNSEPNLSSEFEIFLDESDSQDRPIMVFDSERKAGAVAWISELESRSRGGQVEIRLQPAATVKGRLVDGQGVAVAGGMILSGVGELGEIHGIIPTREGQTMVRNKHLQFQARGVTSLQADGSFEVLLPPGKPWVMFLQNHTGDPVIMESTELAPGEQVDLGTIDISVDERPQPIRLSAEDTPDISSPMIRGIVRGPDRQPIEAQIWLAGPARPEGWSRDLMQTHWSIASSSDRDGRFELRKPERSIRQRSKSGRSQTVRVAATAPGYGYAWVDVPLDSFQNPIELQLVNDVEIHGRFITTEGEPIAGVELTTADVYAPESVPDSANLIKNADKGSGIYTNWPAWFGGPPNSTKMVTDADGHFRMKGFGAERKVRLQARGAGIGATRLSVLTRVPPDNRPGGMIVTRKGLGESQYFADFTHVAVPGREIRGVVFDQTTKEPLGSVRIVAPSSWVSRSTPAMTDAAGRFQILGVPQDDSYELELTPEDGTGHFRKRVTLEEESSTGILTTNIELTRGIIMRGRVVDQQTNQGVGAAIEYNALFPNENVDEFDEGSIANPLSTTHADEDGNFAITVLPGFGAIGVRASGDRFAGAFVDPEEVVSHFQGVKIESRPDDLSQYVYFPTAAGGQHRGLMGLSQYQAFKLLNVERDSPPGRLQLDLHPISKRPGEVFDTDGQPLTGVEVIGLGPSWTTSTRDPLASHKFEILGLVPGQSRILMFLHRQRSLGAAVTVTGDEQSPIQVTLRPTGGIQGRFVDSLSEPLTSVQVEELTPETLHLYGTGFWTPETNEDGSFRCDNLIDGVSYELRAKVPGKPVALFVRGDIQSEPGQTIDVGTFRLTDENRFEAIPQPGAK